MTSIHWTVAVLSHPKKTSRLPHSLLIRHLLRLHRLQLHNSPMHFRAEQAHLPAKSSSNHKLTELSSLFAVKLCNCIRTRWTVLCWVSTCFWCWLQSTLWLLRLKHSTILLYQLQLPKPLHLNSVGLCTTNCISYSYWTSASWEEMMSGIVVVNEECESRFSSFFSFFIWEKLKTNHTREWVRWMVISVASARADCSKSAAAVSSQPLLLNQHAAQVNNQNVE